VPSGIGTPHSDCPATRAKITLPPVELVSTSNRPAPQPCAGLSSNLSFRPGETKSRPLTNGAGTFHLKNVGFDVDRQRALDRSARARKAIGIGELSGTADRQRE
jgi:hypothetical protein